MNLVLAIFAVLFLLALASFYFILPAGRRLGERKPAVGPEPRFAPEEILSEEYALEVAPIPWPTAVPVAELPLSYEETRLTLLVRDPEWLFAYWEISPDDWDRLRGQHGDQLFRLEHIVLRIAEMAGDMASFELNVGGLRGEWHIRVGRPDTAYYGILGVRHGDRFVPVCSSNAVITPRSGFSNQYDDEWMLVNDHEQRLLKQIGELPIDLTSPFMFRKDGSV
ncbi:MAG: DUF4912 domain-containing protein [Solirubrobacterales bacterium]